MIVVISNRNLKGKLNGKAKSFSFLGKDLSGKGNIYAKIVKDNNKLLIYTEDEKDKLFNEIVHKVKAGNKELSRPWVLFLHGNNQDYRKKFKKSDRH